MKHFSLKLNITISRYFVFNICCIFHKCYSKIRVTIPLGLCNRVLENCKRSDLLKCWCNTPLALVHGRIYRKENRYMSRTNVTNVIWISISENCADTKYRRFIVLVISTWRPPRHHNPISLPMAAAPGPKGEPRATPREKPPRFANWRNILMATRRVIIVILLLRLMPMPFITL